MGIKKMYPEEDGKTIRKRLFVVFFIVVFVVIIFGILPMTIKYENNLQRVKFKPATENLELSDTLRISVDLGKEENLDLFIEKRYPEYEILEYKHIASEYSAWDGQHNFYEFILVKK